MQKIFRTLSQKGLRILSRSITLLFALFCAASGLLNGSTASPNGTVRNRIDYAPIGGIRVIMYGQICPVSGSGIACQIDEPLDTAGTDRKGEFRFNTEDPGVIEGHMVSYVVQDIDGSINGSFVSDTLVPSWDDTALCLYMLPEGESIPVYGAVLNKSNNQPISNIQLVLYYPVYNYFWDIRKVPWPLDTVYSDKNGRFRFYCEGKNWGAFAIFAYDVDGLNNGGMFKSTTSQWFDPLNDTSSIKIFMPVDDSVSTSRNFTNRPIKPSVIKTVHNGPGSFSFMLSGVKSGTPITVINAQGVVVATHPLSSEGVFHWNSHLLPSGLYVLQIPYQNRFIHLRVAVP